MYIQLLYNSNYLFSMYMLFIYYLFLSHHNLILCILYKCHMSCINECSISMRLNLKTRWLSMGAMGEFCLQHYCRANDVFDDKTLAVLCSVCGLFMHKLIKYLLMSRRLSDYHLIQL